VWGSAGLVLFPPESIAHQVFVAFVLAGMAAGGISVLAPRMEACLAFLLPALLPLAIHYLTLRTPLHTAMGALTLIFLAGMALSAWNVHRVIRSALHLRFDNQDLEAEVERRHRAEELVIREQAKLKESEAQFRQLAEYAPHLVWVARADGEAEWFNQRLLDYAGVSPSTLEGQQWQRLLHPDDLPEVVALWQRSLHAGESFRIETRLRRYDNEWRWFIASAAPLTGGDGKVVRWFGTCTEMHEEKLLQEALQRSYGELEQFTYVAAHDLQEPLRVAALYAQLVQRHSGADSQVAEYARHIDEQARRMQRLLEDLLTYSQLLYQDEARPVGVADLEPALAEAMELLEDRVARTGAVVTSAALPRVHADQEQLSLVLVNLIGNAIKYARQGVPPRVVLEATRAGDEWIICVRDNGIGFLQEYAEQIFGLFKRLHPSGVSGTGLGLAICRRIVERYGGRIWAESRGEGAAFYFSLPAADDPL
jgi:PAS domain S-box-containing protein